MAQSSGDLLDPRSHLYFRQFIGILGILFPFILLFGRWIFEGWGVLDSISAYYYSVSMRNAFVCGLVALAILLIAYHYARADTLASDVAGICAILVALFPTAPANADRNAKIIGTMHYAFAALFFLILAYFALFLFTKPTAPLARLRAWLMSALFRRPAAAGDKSGGAVALTARKRTRNAIYIACGCIILACVALIAALNLPSLPNLSSIHPMYWLESIAIWAFGAAWFVKGELILQDEGAKANFLAYYASKLMEWLHRPRLR